MIKNMIGNTQNENRVTILVIFINYATQFVMYGLIANEAMSSTLAPLQTILAKYFKYHFLLS